MTNNGLLYKALRYLAQAIAIYLIFRYVPRQPMHQLDIILITVIITLVYILLENLLILNNPPVDAPTPQSCSSVCSLQKKTEGMDNLALKEEQINNLIKKEQELRQIMESNSKNLLNDALDSKNRKIGINNINPLATFELLYRKKQDAGESSNESISESSDYSSEDYPPTYYQIPKSDNIERVGSRANDGVITNDMPYDDFNHLPVSAKYKTQPADFGYSFLPPENWYPQPPNPPICVSEKQCPVCPIYTSGTNLDVKEWHESDRITPPDNINTKFVKEKLNAGR